VDDDFDEQPTDPYVRARANRGVVSRPIPCIDGAESYDAWQVVVSSRPGRFSSQGRWLGLVLIASMLVVALVGMIAQHAR